MIFLRVVLLTAVIIIILISNIYFQTVLMQPEALLKQGVLKWYWYMGILGYIVGPILIGAYVFLKKD